MSRLRTLLLTITAVAALSAPMATEATAAAGARTVQASSTSGATAAASAPAATRDLSKYKEDKVSGGNLMLVAYMVMWGLIAALVGRAVMRQAKLEAELIELAERVDALTDRDGAAS